MSRSVKDPRDVSTGDFELMIRWRSEIAEMEDMEIMEMDLLRNFSRNMRIGLIEHKLTMKNLGFKLNNWGFIHQPFGF